jgi:dCMP deaminase
MGSGTDDASAFASGKTQESAPPPPSPPLYPTRKTWPAYFIAIAHAASSRATCDRKHVGCVITRDNRILVTGYNGSIPGAPHCDEVGHDMKDGHCVRTVHAEANAVAQAARYGVSLAETTAYINTFPCWACFKMLASAGVSCIVFDDDYREDPRVRDGAQQAGVSLVKFIR